jgi:hypothetical protein
MSGLTFRFPPAQTQSQGMATPTAAATPPYVDPWASVAFNLARGSPSRDVPLRAPMHEGDVGEGIPSQRIPSLWWAPQPTCATNPVRDHLTRAIQNLDRHDAGARQLRGERRRPSRPPRGKTYQTTRATTMTAAAIATTATVEAATSTRGF